jgi:hypothetical protein
VVEHGYSHRRHAYHPFRFDLAADGLRAVDVMVASPRVQGAVTWTRIVWREIDSLEVLPMGTAQRRIAAALAETEA